MYDHYRKLVQMSPAQKKR